MLGYDSTTEGYKLYDTQLRKQIISRNAIFYELEFPGIGSDDGNEFEVDNIFTIQERLNSSNNNTDDSDVETETAASTTGDSEITDLGAFGSSNNENSTRDEYRFSSNNNTGISDNPSSARDNHSLIRDKITEFNEDDCYVRCRKVSIFLGKYRISLYLSVFSRSSRAPISDSVSIRSSPGS